MPDETDDHVDASLPAPGGERTGVPAVDRVLTSVESVGELPLTERVALFERAHDELRRALDPHPATDAARG